MTRKQRNILNFLGLILLLIILPLGGLYFLEKGVDYRKELLTELHDFGKMPGFSLSNYDETIIDNKRLEKSLVIVNFFDRSVQEKNSKKIAVLAKMAKQFEDREDILFLNFVSKEPFDSTGSSVLSDYVRSFEFDKYKQWFFVEEDPVTLERMATLSFRFPFENGETFRENSLVALCDTTHSIRRHYNLLDAEESRLLVKHIVMLLPEKESRQGKYDIEE